MAVRWRHALLCVFLVVLGAGGALPGLAFGENGVGSQKSHIFWKAQSTQNTVYLLGSIHVLRAEDYPLAPEVYDAFQQVSTVMFEVDLEGLSSPESQMNMLKKGFLPPGQNLQSMLSGENYETAKQGMAELGMNIEAFDRMKPWMAATAITAMELQKLGFESALGVDRHFFQKAQQDGKTIVGLESIEFQLSLLDNLSSSVQELFLLQSLEDLKNIQERIRDLVQAWTEGDVPTLEGILSSMKEYPELYDALVVQRNNDWLPQIETALQEAKPVLIVVGTLHLIGKDGLVQALKAKGYTLQQL